MHKPVIGGVMLRDNEAWQNYLARYDGTLISSGFIDEHLYFFDVKKILGLYEKKKPIMWMGFF
ncbi:MAG TPA: hypothetical protein VF412_13605 [Bdellovibrio sp.]|uniref:hypothetical protein n=1 Tax=Bdellovibrio sp. TaxID=28201 RepID=UPI002EEF961B